MPTLQTQLQDAAIRQTPPVELLPFARRVLELSAKAGAVPSAQLQESLMRLAIDAITQAEGSLPQRPPLVTGHLNHQNWSTTKPPLSQQPSSLTRRNSKTATAPATTGVAPVADDGNGSEAPVSSTNRNTLKAEAKLKKALDYLIDLNEQTTNRSKNGSLTHRCSFH